MYSLRDVQNRMNQQRQEQIGHIQRMDPNQRLQYFVDQENTRGPVGDSEEGATRIFRGFYNSFLNKPDQWTDADLGMRELPFSGYTANEQYINGALAGQDKARSAFGGEGDLLKAIGMGE